MDQQQNEYKMFHIYILVTISVHAIVHALRCVECTNLPICILNINLKDYSFVTVVPVLYEFVLYVISSKGLLCFYK